MTVEQRRDMIIGLTTLLGEFADEDYSDRTSFKYKNKTLAFLKSLADPKEIVTEYKEFIVHCIERLRDIHYSVDLNGKWTTLERSCILAGLDIMFRSFNNEYYIESWFTYGMPDTAEDRRNAEYSELAEDLSGWAEIVRYAFSLCAHVNDPATALYDSVFTDANAGGCMDKACKLMEGFRLE